MRHGLVQYNPTPHLRHHPHRTLSLATVVATFTIVPTVRITVRLPTHNRVEFNSPAEAEAAGYRVAGIIRETHPVPPWEWKRK